MRYVDKYCYCKEFDKYIIDKHIDHILSTWENNIPSNIKLILHQHLHKEQGGLCIYCQQKLIPKTDVESNAHRRSHIEHIRPKGKEYYPELQFEYCNLSVSCEGFDCEIPKSNEQQTQEFCEHRKGNKYDEKYFLNPVEIKDIEDYFIYDDLTLEILPKHEEGTNEFKKAEYMISILDLNHSKLVKMRADVVKDIERKGQFDKHEKILPPFYSMLVQFGLY